MAEPIAVWGAVTGTLGLGITAWREISGNKKSVRVHHGWQFVYGNDDRMTDIWFYVMVHNDGRRPVHIEHLGFNFIVDAPEDIKEQVKDMPDTYIPDGPALKHEMRFEIALNGETLEVLPDGPSVKVLTQGKPILATGIDPLTTPMSPFAVSVPERYWWGPESPLLPRLPTGYTAEESASSIQRIAEESRTELEVPSYLELPGQLRGLKRLVLDGDVDRLEDVAPKQREEDPTSTQANTAPKRKS